MHRLEAKKLGLIRFMADVPCPTCKEISVRYTSNNRCCACTGRTRDKSRAKKKSGAVMNKPGHGLKKEWEYGQPGVEPSTYVRPKGIRWKSTIAKEKLYMDNPKKSNETVQEYLLRLLETGKIDAASAPGIVAKLLDKETGNAPTVQLTAELRDTMSDEELELMFKKAGVSQKDDDPKPTKH